MKGFLVVGALLLTLGPLAACGGGDDTPGKPPTAAEVAGFTQFCTLVRELRAAAGTTGAAPTAESYTGPQPAFAAMVDQLGPKLDELRTSAPADVADPVAVVVDAVRKAKDGDPSGTQSASFKDSIQRVDRFQQTRCQTKMPDQETG